MTPLIIDTETTIRNSGDKAVGTFGGSPFSPENFIVANGVMQVNGKEQMDYATDGNLPVPSYLSWPMKGKPTRWVMHNGAFDIAYIIKHWPEEFWKALPYVEFWDTQHVEYLLSGQTHMYPSLDQCAAKRGLPLKDDKIKEYWNNGIDTNMIPKDELLEYLHTDLDNTRLIYLDQVEEVEQDWNLRELVKVKGDDLLMTAIMTFNGMQFDLEFAAQKIAELTPRLEMYQEALRELAKEHLPETLEFNEESGDHLSLILFGGDCKVEESVVKYEEDGVTPQRYKGGARAGEIKTRREKVIRKVKGLGIKADKYGIPKVKSGQYSTDAEYMEKVAKDWPVAEDIGKMRELLKDIGTYYLGYSVFVWPDGRIHPNINQESTATGRQSASNPNVQNVSGDDDD